MRPWLRGKSASTMATDQEDTIRTQIPARMDRLPWSRWHWLVVIGLGPSGSSTGSRSRSSARSAAALQRRARSASARTRSAVARHLLHRRRRRSARSVFGYLTDRLGRKRLFIASSALYLVGHGRHRVLAGAPRRSGSFRFLTGLGIGGEYSAINSAIDELIPARARGWVDLAINGSYWLGAAAGAALSVVLLDKSLFAVDVGWRLAFFLGAVLALAIMFVRRNVPESPRWLMIHGREERGRGARRRDRAATWIARPASRSRSPTRTIEIPQRDSTASWRSRARCSRATRGARRSASR